MSKFFFVVQAGEQHDFSRFVNDHIAGNTGAAFGIESKNIGTWIQTYRIGDFSAFYKFEYRFERFIAIDGQQRKVWIGFVLLPVR